MSNKLHASVQHSWMENFIFLFPETHNLNTKVAQITWKIINYYW